MDFDIPKEIADYLVVLDEFIEKEIKPLENENDNIRFFDHRREDARTDWDRGGLPNGEWEALLFEARMRADRAGHYRYAMPEEFGGQSGTNLGMAIIREHFASQGLGLHNDLQNEHSIVGNNVGVLLMSEYGTEAQKEEWMPLMLEGKRGFAFGITEPDHGSNPGGMITNFKEDGDHVILCGVQIPHTKALKGHSDADVGMHAITDAIYGALADGDIGQHFPPSDPQWKGAASEIFLRHAVDLARDRGFQISNIDCTLICEYPKVGPHAAKMKLTIAQLMDLDANRVSIKATTSEQLGFTGREEGIAALATATLVKA